MIPLDHSNEINFQDFKNIPKHIPFDVLYQTLTSNSFNKSGFQLNINKPYPSALLSRDIWVEYSFVISEQFALDIQNMYENALLNVSAPLSEYKFATRSGNIFAKANQHMSVRINGLEMTYQPCHYMDVLSRLHVSNSQSKHEFSGSGGCFDSGNHGYRTEHQRREHLYAPTRLVPNGWHIVNDNYDANGNTHYDIYVIDGFHPDGQATTSPGTDLVCNLRQTHPVAYDFYNPGFNERFNRTSVKLRTDWNPFGSPVTAQGLQFSTPSAPNNQYIVTLFERLPIPLFKMFSTDGIEGVIPNIRELIIQGQFINISLIENMFQCSAAGFAGIKFDWSVVTVNACKCHLKWFVPKVEIPMSVSINCPRIETVIKQFTQATNNLTASGAGRFYVDTNLHERDISLIAIPDVLLIYANYQPSMYTIDQPNEYNLELLNLQFNMNVSTAKAFGIGTVELYELWKRNLKHKDSDIIGYDEWRKYCFVAVLKPEDYGIKDYREYNLPVQFSVTCTARNWWINPSIMAANAEALGGDGGQGKSMQLVITSIYYRNKLHLTPTDAKQSLDEVK